MKYVPKVHQLARVESAFTFHPPKDSGQTERYEDIRARMKALAMHLIEVCPNSRELNSSLKSLEESQSWAIAAICRNE